MNAGEHELRDQIFDLQARLGRTQRDQRYGFMAMILGAALLSAAVATPQKQRFSEIDVQRINIVEPDGRLRLVIANRVRSPVVMLQGKSFGPGGARPGLISYNDEVTENGGFICSGRRQPDGAYSAEHSLTFDQYEQDATVSLQYIDANGTSTPMVYGAQVCRS